MSLSFLRAAASPVCAGAFPLASAAPSRAANADPSTGDVIRSWNKIAISQPFGNAVRLSRVLAIVRAQHDAINGVEPRYTRYAAPLSKPDVDVAAPHAGRTRVSVDTQRARKHGGGDSASAHRDERGRFLHGGQQFDARGH